MTLFEIDGIPCAIKQVTMSYFGSYWVGYAIFPNEYRDKVERAEECPVDISWFNYYGIPDLLIENNITAFGKPLTETDFCYLGADTAHPYCKKTEAEIREILSEIVKWVLKKA